MALQKKHRLKNAFFLVIITYMYGRRDVPHLVIDDYEYIRYQSTKNVTYWRCNLFDKGICKAKCSVGEDYTVAFSGTHTHAAKEDCINPYRVIKQVVHRRIKNRSAANTVYITVAV